MHDQAARGAPPPPGRRKSRVRPRLEAAVLGWVRGQVREHGGGHDSYGRHEAPWWRAVQHESRVQHRISQLLAQEYEQLLTPEAKQRREAQRRHLQELRAQAEAELAAEDAQRRRR